MQYVLSHITGLDAAVLMLLLVVYLWNHDAPDLKERPNEGLDRGARD